MFSAGYINPEPWIELCQYVDSANIDFKGITNEYYQTVCSATIDPVLKSIKLAVKEGVVVELTNLVIPTLNDKDDDINKLCKWIYNNVGPDVPLHFSRFYPMYKLKNLPLTPKSTLVRAREIAISNGLHYVYIGNVPDNPGENTYCPKCGEFLIGRIGYYVTDNKVKKGKCPQCGNHIVGIWD